MLGTTPMPGPSHKAPHTVYVPAMMTPAYLIPAIIIRIISIMAAININTVASPVTMDNFSKIGDQYLNLSVLDCITNEILRIRAWKDAQTLIATVYDAHNSVSLGSNENSGG